MGFNDFVSKIFKIKNKKTGEIKSFKSRKDFIDFLKKEVNLISPIKLTIFNKDILILRKEELVNKYLEHWYYIKN